MGFRVFLQARVSNLIDYFVFKGAVQISFDAKGKQIHMTETVKTGNESMKLTTLQLYEQVFSSINPTRLLLCFPI